MKINQINRRIIKCFILCSIIMLGLFLVKTNSHAYTEEQINQAKAWLSAHGYSPTRAGAGQAMADYESGKLKLGEKEKEIAEKSGYKVKDSNKNSNDKKKKTKKSTKKNNNKSNKNNKNNKSDKADKSQSKEDDYVTSLPTVTDEPIVYNASEADEATEATEEPVKDTVIEVIDETVKDEDINTDNTSTDNISEAEDAIEVKGNEFPFATMGVLVIVAVFCIVVLIFDRRK